MIIYPNSVELPEHKVSATEAPYVSDYYLDRYHQWKRNRDVVAGESVVKRAGDMYLIPFSSQQSGDTERDKEIKLEYLRRAIFAPFSQKLVYGVSGALTRHKPMISIDGFIRPNRKISDLELLDQFFPFDMSLTDAILIALQEIMKTGTIGFWVNDGIIHLYSAENILNHQSDYVLLKEVIEPSRKISDVQRRQKQRLKAFSETRDEYVVRYRELTFRGDAFIVRTYNDKFKRTHSTFPKIRGKKLNYIPFYCVKARTDMPMISDIVALNLNHYNLSALIAQAQRFSSFPIYAVPIPRGTQAKTPKYFISPFRVWEYPADTKGPSVLEFYGQSLQTLQSSLKDIEFNIAAAGARIVGIGVGRDNVEEPTIFHLLQKMEQSVLLHVCRVLEDTLSTALEEAIRQAYPVKRPSITLRIQKSELIMSPIGDRMLRALSSLVKEAQMPPENLYEILLAQGFIPDDMSFTDFTSYVIERVEEQRKVDLDHVRAQTLKLKREAEMKKKQNDDIGKQIQKIEKTVPGIQKSI